MGLFSRSQELPPELRDLLGGKNPLAWAHHSGGVIAATRQGIVSVDNHETLALGWEDLIQAVWTPPMLSVVSIRDGISQTHAWLLEEPAQVPAVVRDRVTHSVVADHMRTFTPGGVVQFVARRVGSGVEWVALPHDQEWAATEIGARSITNELADLRRSLGV